MTEINGNDFKENMQKNKLLTSNGNQL